MGEMLIVPGTDIHWGDPVNTSSKLGQDWAHDGTIIVSEAVAEKVKGDARLAPYEMKAREVELSGVKFQANEVWDKVISAAEKKNRVIEVFRKAKVPSLMLDKALLAKVIMQLSPRFTTQQIEAMFDSIAGPDSSTINLEDFLERGCSCETPGAHLAKSTWGMQV